jgi:hypothetical protein
MQSWSVYNLRRIYTHLCIPVTIHAGWWNTTAACGEEGNKSGAGGKQWILNLNLETQDSSFELEFRQENTILIQAKKSHSNS